MTRSPTSTSPGLEVRLARTVEEVLEAQRLRFRIFYEEMGAVADAKAKAERVDRDQYDAWCDHLLVIDHDAPAERRVVGTYRLLRGAVARRHHGFYSAGEFDLSPLLGLPGEVLELGRSCVDPAYRNRAAMQMLWQGIAEYVYRHQVGVLFGCASLPGTDVASMRHLLAYLHHECRAPAELCPRALPGRYVPMGQLPAEAVDRAAAWRELPPLLRGYLRIGGRIGDGAVIDWEFGTTDVCLVLETEGITARYRRHYGDLVALRTHA
jgi:putative hemolysin